MAAPEVNWARSPRDAVVVVQLGAADAHGNVQVAALAAAGGGDGAERGGNHVVFLLGDLVAQEVGRRVGLLFQNAEIAVQLVAHSVQDGGRLGDRPEKQEEKRPTREFGHDNIQDSISKFRNHRATAVGFTRCA